MLEQVDIAVDLGVVAAPLPEILNLRQLVETAPSAPPQIIEGALHQGCKDYMSTLTEPVKNDVLKTTGN